MIPKVNHKASRRLGDTPAPLELMDAQAQVLFELASDGLLIVQTAGQTIVAANAAACASLGYSREELCHQPLSRLVCSYRVSSGEWCRLSPEALRVPTTPEVLSSLTLHQQDGRYWQVQVTLCDEFLPGHQLWQLRSRSPFAGESPNPQPAFPVVNQDTALSIWDAQQRYEDLLHSLDGIVWEFDLASQRFTFVSQRLEKILGYTPEQWLANANLWQNSIHPDDREAALHTCFSRSRTENDFHIEYRMITATGQVVWLQDWVSVVRSQQQPVKLRGVLVDISDRKQVEAHLQTSEAQIRLITDSVPCLIAYVDAQQRYQFVNQQYANWVGRDRAHILGRSMRTVLETAHYRQVQPHIQTVLSGQPVNFEATLPDSQQRLHHVHISYVPHHHSNGEVLGFYVLIEDVTTLKESESRLRESEARYRSVVEAISEGIILHQADGTITACNTAAERILGLPAEQILGKSVIDPMWRTIHEDGSPFLGQDYPASVTLRTGQPQSQVVIGIYRPDGNLRWLLVNSQPIFQPNSPTLHAVVVSFSDITERRAAEQRLRSQELRLRLALEAAAMGTWELLASDAPWTLCSEHTRTIYGIPADQDLIEPAVLWERIHPDDRDRVTQAIATSFAQRTPWYLEYRLQHPDGQEHWVSVWATVFTTNSDATPKMVGIIRDITQQKQAEATLRYQGEQEYLMRLMTQHIHQSLDLDQILNTAVVEVRQFLQVDRALIYQLHPLNGDDATRLRYDVAVRAESIAPGCLSMLGWLLRDPWLQSEPVLASLQTGTPYTVTYFQDADPLLNLSPAAQDFLEFFQIRAVLMVPILHGESLWGVLVAHQCHTAQPWQPIDMRLLLQLVVQIGIAIQQAELYQTVQQLNQNLEQQVQERTAQLQQMLAFEALLQRITDKVRESIDEAQILQTAVKELALGLNLACCDTGIYNAEQTASTIRYEYTQNLPSAHGTVIPFADSPDPAVYAQLLQGQASQFCFMASSFVRPVRYQYVILACPIVDDHGVIGDLWLFRRQPHTFSDPEVRLVQQVANHCAIGVRQARLYQAAQSQVAELARLNRLKDDFLSTISHELRTPLSNMNNAIQMLELFLAQPNLFHEDAETTLRLKPSRAASYLQILRHQYQEELELVNDLLDLSRLESGRVTLEQTIFDLRTWLPYVLELFDDRIRSHNQQLHVEIDPHLPLITSDRTYLEHILKELLNNACKYTPAGEEIRVQLRAKSPHIYLIVTNTGVTIPPTEIPHLFEKFYRVPTADPWKYGGTGLGLALVEQRVKQLGGRIWAESQPNLTRFIVELPQTTTV
ncbi:PAS domain S-box protein [Trichothermofontia sp.]